MKEIFKGRVVFVHSELSKWLYNCISNKTTIIPKEELLKQYVLTSAILQFVDFLNYLYKTHESDKYKMNIQNFLSEQLRLDQLDIVDQLSYIEDKKQDVDNLVSQLDILYWNKIVEYIDEIGKKYHVHIYRSDNAPFYFYCELNFNGMPINIVLGNDRDGAGDYCQIETKQQRRRIPEAIRNDFDISEELNDAGNRNDCIWRYDSYKESLLRFDRILGRLLDLIKEEQV